LRDERYAAARGSTLALGMARNALMFLSSLALCASCTNGRNYELQLESDVDPTAFASSLDRFLHYEGFKSDLEMHEALPSEIRGSLPLRQAEWELSKFRAGAGVVSVGLSSPYNPIQIVVGGSTNRVKEIEKVTEDLQRWLHREYPNIHIALVRSDYFNPT
jgi:hypothetical protein